MHAGMTELGWWSVFKAATCGESSHLDERLERLERPQLNKFFASLSVFDVKDLPYGNDAKIGG
jgi:hypothetical protein